MRLFTCIEQDQINLTDSSRRIFFSGFRLSVPPLSTCISSRCFLPAPLLCPPAVLLLSASFSLMQNHRALPSGGALRNFFARGVFCSCCPLPPLPPHSQSPLLSPCGICLLPHLLLPLSHCPQTPFRQNFPKGKQCLAGWALASARLPCAGISALTAAATVSSGSSSDSGGKRRQHHMCAVVCG